VVLEFCRPGFWYGLGDSKVELDGLAKTPQQFDMAFSDVPYGLKLDIVGDEDAAKTATWTVPKTLALLKPAAPIVFWNAESTAPFWVDVLENHGATVHRLIPWDKDSHYFDRRARELLIVASNGPTLATYNDDTASVWTHRTVRDQLRRESFKTPKPSALEQRALRRFAPPGARVLDPFAGGGDIALACLTLGFGYAGFEIVPEHVTAGVDRLETLARAQDANARLARILQRRSGK
jgi:DNA modification methylase